MIEVDTVEKFESIHEAVLVQHYMIEVILDLTFRIRLGCFSSTLYDRSKSARIIYRPQLSLVLVQHYMIEVRYL